MNIRKHFSKRQLIFLIVFIRMVAVQCLSLCSEYEQSSCSVSSCATRKCGPCKRELFTNAQPRCSLSSSTLGRTLLLRYNFLRPNCVLAESACLQALAGLLLFGENHGFLWWIGLCLIVSGTAIIRTCESEANELEKKQK